MARRWRRTDAPRLFVAAAAAYGANVALGTAVAVRLIDTRRFRWVHHVLYIITCVATGAALSAAFWARPAVATRRAAAFLAPAIGPLAVIPYAGTRTRRHPLVALAAAPFIVAGLVASRLPSDRK